MSILAKGFNMLLYQLPEQNTILNLELKGKVMMVIETLLSDVETFKKAIGDNNIILVPVNNPLKWADNMHNIRTYAMQNDISIVLLNQYETQQAGYNTGLWEGLKILNIPTKTLIYMSGTILRLSESDNAVILKHREIELGIEVSLKDVFYPEDKDDRAEQDISS